MLNTPAKHKRLLTLCGIGCCFRLLLAGPAEAHPLPGESAGETLPSVHPNVLNMTLVDSILLGGVTDLYVSGDHAYVGHRELDVLHIVDISQPQAMRLDTSLTLLGTRSVDVKVSGNLAAVGAQRNFSGEAIFIDISEPPNPEILSSFEASDRGGVHNLFLHKNRAYLVSAVGEGLTILDISDPAKPIESNFWMNEIEGFSSYIHDVFIRDDMAFLSVQDHEASSGGLVILDLADPDYPVTLSSVPVAKGLHSAWMENGFVYCNQEFGGWDQPLRIIDATDPRHPVEVGVFRAQPPPFAEIVGPHNPYVRDGLLYWAYYDAGVRIFDLATQDKPVEIAYFLTPGAWGAQPHTDGLIYVADDARHVRGSGEAGLLALRFDEPSHAIRQLSLSSDLAVAGRSERLTVTATTAPSPRGIAGQISRVSASFFSPQESEEWMLLDDGTAGDAAGGTRLFTGHLEVPRHLPSGKHRIRVQLEDDQARIYPFDVPFHIVPAEDLVLFGDALAGQWQPYWISGVELDVQESGVVYQGASALAFRNVNFLFRAYYGPINFVDAFGFASLHFAFHPGDAIVPPNNSPELSVVINEVPMPLLYGRWKGQVDMDVREWQLVDIPLDLLELEVITMIGFTGSLQGTFYVDDLRVVAATSPTSPPPVTTAVQEEHTTALPKDFSLEQNYPNPFNSDTVIRFEMREEQHVELAVFNLAGQNLVHLVEGSREAGVHTVHWNGRNERGSELSSGVYVYRLQAGKGRTKTRKMALVR